jgi:hypothetical protein
MSEEKRNLVWPIVLIAVGVVLLLAEFGVLSFSWTDLVRLWPVALILAGLSLLLRDVRYGWAYTLAAAVLVIAAALWLWGRMPSADARLTTDEIVFPVAGVESAEVRLDMGMGELQVDTMSDSANLLEAEIAYDARNTRIESELEAEKGVATARISSNGSGVHLLNFGTVGEKWRVRLNADVPTRLRLSAGVSESEIDLRAATVTALDINAGVGDMTVRLPEREAYRVRVNGGVGELTLYVAVESEARIHVDGGLGSVKVASRFERQGDDYFTAGYRAGGDAIEIDIDGGVGAIEIR